MIKKTKSTNKKSSAKSKKILKHKIKKTSEPRFIQTSKGVEVEKILIENFVSLQKVMANLSGNFDKLASQISKLLELFEISAKALAEKEFDFEKGNKDNKGNKDEENKKITERIDNLFEQNKIIAKGLTLLHEPDSRQAYPAPQRPMQKPLQPKSEKQDMNEYQKSISSQQPKSSDQLVSSSASAIRKFKPLAKY